jgi:hypothetical protein
MNDAMGSKKASIISRKIAISSMKSRAKPGGLSASTHPWLGELWNCSSRWIFHPAAAEWY